MKCFIRSFFILGLSIHLQKNCTKSFRLRNIFPFSQMRSVIPLLWKIVRPADSYKQYDTPHRQCNPKTHPSQSTT